jgi:hypothetical protein
MKRSLRYRIKHRTFNSTIAAFDSVVLAEEYLDTVSPGWSALYIYDSITKNVFMEGISASRRRLLEGLDPSERTADGEASQKSYGKSRKRKQRQSSVNPKPDFKVFERKTKD